MGFHGPYGAFTDPPELYSEHPIQTGSAIQIGMAEPIKLSVLCKKKVTMLSHSKGKARRKSCEKKTWSHNSMKGDGFRMLLS